MHLDNHETEGKIKKERRRKRERGEKEEKGGRETVRGVTEGES